MMKQIFFVCVILLACIACRQETIEERFARDARTLTQQCPITVDVHTNLDSLVYNNTNFSYQYYYSLSGIDDKQFANLVTLSSFIEEIKTNIVNSAEMKPYKDAGLSFIYYYYSRTSGVLLGSVTVTPEDYNR